MNDIANKSIKEHFKLKVHAQNDFPNSIKNISEILIQTLSNENKLMWCGNGGSAAQAEHLSAELLGGLNKKKIELSQMAYKSQQGYNANEVSIIPKNVKKAGFFEKFFQLFS